MPTKAGGSNMPEGVLIGEGLGPLGNAPDRRVWTVNGFGLRIYAAASYCVQIEQGGTRGRVQVDPDARESRSFMAAMGQAFAYAKRRSPNSPWPPKAKP
jgi:hypothetical protein